MNLIKNKNMYEVYIYIEDNNYTVSNLLSKKFKNRIFSNIYFYILRLIIFKGNIKFITKILKSI